MAEDDPPGTVTTMGCPYCAAFLRRDAFLRRFWQWLTHPMLQVVEQRKKCLRNNLIAATVILCMFGMIFLAAALHWNVSGG